MKFTFIQTPQREEVVVYAPQKSPLVQELQRLAEAAPLELVGRLGQESVPLEPAEIACFFVENNKVYAYRQQEKLQLKHRLYQLEARLPGDFIRINQSCIANTRQIARFVPAFSGALQVVFKNGHTDYVSRRQLKTVKERFGI